MATGKVSVTPKAYINANENYWIPCYGYITNDGKEVDVYAAISITRFTSETITNKLSQILCSIRTVTGGYIGGASSTDLTSYVTSVQLLSAGRGLSVRLENSNGWGYTNNTPIAGQMRVSFSEALQ